MRKLMLVFLALVTAWALSGCFTLAWKGTKKVSALAAEKGPPGVRQVGQATHGGMERVDEAKDEAIDRVTGR